MTQPLLSLTGPQWHQEHSSRLCPLWLQRQLRGDHVCGGDPHQESRLVGVRRLRGLRGDPLLGQLVCGALVIELRVVRLNRLLQLPLLLDPPDVRILDRRVPVGLVLRAEPATFVPSACHRLSPSLVRVVA